MAYEIYQAIDEWTEAFYQSKERIVQDGRKLMAKFNQPVGKPYQLKHPNGLNFEFTIIFHPQGMIQFSGQSLIGESSFDFIRYNCFSNYIESLDTMRMEDEVVMIVRTGRVQTAPPGLKMAQALNEIGKSLFSKREEPRLQGDALEQLMLIQQEVMVKEKDTAGLLQLREAFFGLQQDDPSSGKE